MASIVTPKANPKHRWIQFLDRNRRRQTIRLGHSTNKIAEQHCRVVESILAFQSASIPLDGEVCRFIAGLDSTLRKRYEACGLVKAVEQDPVPTAQTIGKYLDHYFGSRKVDVKESSSVAFSHTHKRLIEYFRADKPLAEITPTDARNFRTWLLTTNKRDKPKEGEAPNGLAQNTVRRRMGFCKQVFSQAVMDGIILRNPFQGIAASVRSNKERQTYVDLETFSKVLAMAPNVRWRALLVLARVGALRVPSEVAKLKWDHINFEAKRILIVDSSKTEHHANRAIRRIPMMPSLEKELLAWFAESPEGDDAFPDIKGDSNLRTTLEKIIARAGVKQWPKLWQNLRASACTDFARTLPSHVAAAICGHTKQIAQEHYWTVDDSDLDAVIEGSVKPEAVDLKPEANSEAVRSGIEQNGLAHSFGPPTKTQETNEIIGEQWTILDSNQPTKTLIEAINRLLARQTALALDSCVTFRQPKFRSKASRYRQREISVNRR